MPVGVLRRFRLSSLVHCSDTELVLIAFLQLRDCTLADIALDFYGLVIKVN